LSAKFKVTRLYASNVSEYQLLIKTVKF
jgi:hypothetical protein